MESKKVRQVKQILKNMEKYANDTYNATFKEMLFLQNHNYTFTENGFILEFDIDFIKKEVVIIQDSENNNNFKKLSFDEFIKFQEYFLLSGYDKIIATLKQPKLNTKRLFENMSVLTDLKIASDTELIIVDYGDNLSITLITNYTTKTNIVIFDGDYYIFKNCDVGNIETFNSHYNDLIENDLTL